MSQAESKGEAMTSGSGFPLTVFVEESAAFECSH